jgi:hypothetical protein
MLLEFGEKRLSQSIGPIEQVPPEDVDRIQFPKRYFK